MPVNPKHFIHSIEMLCGRVFSEQLKVQAIERLSPIFDKRFDHDEFSCRQLNEALLLLNKRIVTGQFFEFLAGLGNGEKSDTIQFGRFQEKVDEFRKLAMLEYGSFRFAYNLLSTKTNPGEYLKKWRRTKVERIEEYGKRKSPLCEVQAIPSDQLHYLGYYSGKDADQSLLDNARKIGRQNFDTYLTWDYLDVYVATSMRRPFEYQAVNRLCNEVFKKGDLASIGVRYFDPTLNYHPDSIAKSLIEGLMLKRAKCTLYLAQESDTMGKDSELAATLAQGKPVVAYVPSIDDVALRIEQLRDVTLDELIIIASIIEKTVADPDVPDFEKSAETISDIAATSANEKDREKRLIENAADYDTLLQLTAKYEQVFYDKRAKGLKYAHPLRFQMHLETGVANGVLVARSFEECRQLIYKLLTGTIEFEILSPGQICDDKADFGAALEFNHILIEKSTRSAFRVVTTDEKLTNSFWSLYKRQDK